jgi:hypothetical protein
VIEPAQFGAKRDQVRGRDLAAGGLLQGLRNRGFGRRDHALLERLELPVDGGPVPGVFHVSRIGILAVQQAVGIDLGVSGPNLSRILVGDG